MEMEITIEEALAHPDDYCVLFANFNGPQDRSISEILSLPYFWYGSPDPAAQLRDFVDEVHGKISRNPPRSGRDPSRSQA
jgi:hypothetical protein